MKSEVDTFLSYYLTENDDAALSFIDARISVPPYEVPPNSVSVSHCITWLVSLLTYLFQYTKFDFVRDYETTKVEQDITNEFILNVDDGDDFDDVKPGQQSRGKGAYYKNVERKMTLNKRRANVRTASIRTVPPAHLSLLFIAVRQPRRPLGCHPSHARRACG